jgi:hypothetical protein
VNAAAAETTHKLTISPHDGRPKNFSNAALRAVPVEFTPPETEYLPGDADGDGSVTMGDVVTLSRFVSGLQTLTDAQKLAADTDGDGSITMGDVVSLSRIISGLSN